MNLTGVVARKLAQRSSRRQFFKLLGAGSLGTGLFLTGTGVSLGAATFCVGCGGGPCNPCVGIGPICDNASFPCKTCAQGGGCGTGCQTSGEWFCCQPSGCRIRCSECNCPPGCDNLACHCFVQLPMPCNPRVHSGDRPCTCPPADAPLPSLA